MDPTIIHGQRVILRRKRADDLHTLWAYIYGEDSPEWKKWDTPYFPLQHMDFNAYKQQAEPALTAIYPELMVIEVNGEIIGTVRYYWEHERSRSLEAGIVIFNPAYWNDGYGTEALSLWIENLFVTLPLVRVGISTWSGNKRMIHLAKKIGMQLEGRIRKSRYYNGMYYDAIRMGILKEEWAAEKANPNSSLFQIFN